ncbi:NAC domain-containing protein 104 isoform X2 [Arachis ipaensis]|uniref:NAC domain-containing protein n=1 Tax=Arachis hypogaea TaxID=3818 RepID=A0A444X5P6_ARAHY|nr:NAC domain-containing protein 104 isoform X2 [Arachis ipaensis]XP_025685979.1 NAC domain-containing protein 104 isoform X2 [Arachis hypogaea]RYQ85016.1 hypothetical protein Ahy_B10g104498 isoform F [Arachis hypogaea]
MKNLSFTFSMPRLLFCHAIPTSSLILISLSLILPNSTCKYLADKALSSGNQYYFFSKVKEKRITENGYWKEIGESEAILSSTVEKKVGTKKNLVFHIGEAPHGIETSWVMQEYHICRSSNIISTSRARRKHDHQIWSKWVLCKVYEKKGSVRGVNYCSDDDDSGTELSWLDEIYLSLDDDLEEISVSILD